MGLAATMFANTNTNFANVTFDVTDGYVTVTPADVTVVTPPLSADPVYSGEAQALLVAGEVVGGTLYYALASAVAPSDDKYLADIPAATEAGTYYVWYKVVGDDNHNDLSPVCIRVVVALPEWVTIDGVLYASDGVTPMGDTDVALTRGNQTVDTVITAQNGAYRFVVPAGAYNMVAKIGDVVETNLVNAFGDVQQDMTLSAGKTGSFLVVDTADADFGVVVGGLNEEAFAIREAEGISSDKSVSVVMTVEQKTEKTAANAEPILEQIKNNVLTFLDIRVEKRIDADSTLMETTASVLEIAIPYAKASKRGLSVYSYHDDVVRTFKESDSKEDGTFRVDKQNAIIYIYTNKFSTYAIGYTPYYRVTTALAVDGYTGKVNVSLHDKDGNKVYMLEDVEPAAVTFADVAMGEYVMTVTWKEKATNKLTYRMSIGPDGVALAPMVGAHTEQSVAEAGESAPAEKDTQLRRGYQLPEQEDALPTRKETEQEDSCEAKRKGDEED
jgi:hypothetical protein